MLIVSFVPQPTISPIVFDYSIRCRMRLQPGSAHPFQRHGEFKDSYVSNNGGSPYTAIPQSRPGPHTPSRNTQLSIGDSAYCSTAVASYVRPIRDTKEKGSDKIPVEATAAPGTPAFEMAKAIAEDLFAHIMRVSPANIRSVYLDMPVSELSWVLRKFYMVHAP